MLRFRRYGLLAHSWHRSSILPGLPRDLAQHSPHVVLTLHPEPHQVHGEAVARLISIQNGLFAQVFEMHVDCRRIPLLGEFVMQRPAIRLFRLRADRFRAVGIRILPCCRIHI